MSLMHLQVNAKIANAIIIGTIEIYEWIAFDAFL